MMPLELLMLIGRGGDAVRCCEVGDLAPWSRGGDVDGEECP